MSINNTRLISHTHYDPLIEEAGKLHSHFKYTTELTVLLRRIVESGLTAFRIQINRERNPDYLHRSIFEHMNAFQLS